MTINKNKEGNRKNVIITKKVNENNSRGNKGKRR